MTDAYPYLHAVKERKPYDYMSDENGENHMEDIVKVPDAAMEKLALDKLSKIDPFVDREITTAQGK